MSESQIRYQIHKAIRRYQLLRLTEIALVAIAVGLITFTLLRLTPAKVEMILLFSVLTAIAWIIFRSIQLNLFRVDENHMIRFVNRTYP